MVLEYRRRLSVLVGVAVCAVAGPAHSQTPEATLAAELTSMQYLIGGTWMADTPQPAGDGRSFTPAIQYTSILGGKVLKAVMTWVFADGERRRSWEAYTYYHPQRRQIVHTGLWSTGMVVEGHYDTLGGGDSLRLDFTVHWPAGSADDLPTKWYSVEHRVHHDRHDEIAFMEIDGEWQQNIRLTYVRHAAPSRNEP